MSDKKPVEKMLKAELAGELLATRERLESERNAFDQLAMVAAKGEADLGEVFALLAEAHDLREHGGYHDDDAERWSAWDRRASELLQHHREGTPLPFRTAEEAELALEVAQERFANERTTYQEETARLRVRNEELARKVRELKAELKAKPRFRFWKRS